MEWRRKGEEKIAEDVELFGDHDGVSHAEIMLWVLIFFCKDIAYIGVPSNVLKFYFLLVDLFTDCIFANLNVTETLSCKIV